MTLFDHNNIIDDTAYLAVACGVSAATQMG